LRAWQFSEALGDVLKPTTLHLLLVLSSCILA